MPSAYLSWRKAGLYFGYYPNPGKAWNIHNKEDKEDTHAAFSTEGLSIQFTNRQQYIDSFIWSDASHCDWFAPLVANWVAGIKTLAAVVFHYLQTAYTRMVTSLLVEWQNVCCVIQGIETELAPIKAAIRNNFLLVLFGSSTPFHHWWWLPMPPGTKCQDGLH